MDGPVRPLISFGSAKLTDSPVTILYEGRPLACRTGLSVGAALWEHGVKALSHSHKYGRPRGLSCGRGHCMSCLMRVDGVPNVRVCRTPVREGMRVERQDAGAPYAPLMQKVLDLGGERLPVGFYFKWFTRPAVAREAFLASLRPLTGVGRLPEPQTWDGAAPPAEAVDLGRRATAVIGAGPAGLAAALDAGAGTLLIDDQPASGGHRGPALDRLADAAPDVLSALPRLAALRERIGDLRRRVDETPGLELRPATRVVGAYQPDMLLLRDDSGLALLRTDRIVWAGGAWDRGGDFENNDLPGLLGPRGLYRLLGSQGLSLDGARAVATGRGLDLWLSAALLHAAGARVTVVPDGDGGEHLPAAHALGWTLHTGLSIARATSRGGALAALELSGEGGALKLPADLAVVCRRAKPAYDVPYQLGDDLALDPARGGWVPRGPQAGVLNTVGEARGQAIEEILPEEASP